MESLMQKSPVYYRVRKEGVLRDSWVQPDALDICLCCWKTWMYGDPDKNLGIATRKMLIGDSDGYSIDDGEAQQARDNRIAAATDAMIDSLKRIHSWAIYKSCGLGSVWNFPRADFIAIAEDAKKELEQKLRKNSCTAVLF